MEGVDDSALLRKKSFRLPAGLKMRVLVAATALGALVLELIVLLGFADIMAAIVVAALYVIVAFLVVRMAHAEIRADDRGVQTAVRQAFRPKRIPWKEVATFETTECAGGELIAVARLRDGNDVVLPELRTEYPWAWRWGRNDEAIRKICDELNRRRELEVRMFRYAAPREERVGAAIAGV